MKVKYLIDKWEELVQKGLINSEEMNKLGCAAFDLGETEYAFNFFRKAVENNPTVQSLNNLAYLYFYEGDLVNGEWVTNNENAIKLLNSVIHLKPNSHFPYSLLGRIYIEVNRHKDAEILLVEAVKLTQTVANLNNLGVALFKQNRYSDSVSCFEKANLISSKQSCTFYSYFNLGISYAKLERYEEVNAVADFLLNSEEVKSVGSIDISDIVVLYFLCCNYKRVISLFQQVLDLYIISPREFEIYLTSLIYLSKYKEAQEFLKFAVYSNNERINEISSNKDMEATNKEALLSQLKLEIDQYDILYEKILKGIEPQLRYEPFIEEECYLLRNNIQ